MPNFKTGNGQQYWMLQRAQVEKFKSRHGRINCNWYEGFTGQMKVFYSPGTVAHLSKFTKTRSTLEIDSKWVDFMMGNVCFKIINNINWKRKNTWNFSLRKAVFPKGNFPVGSLLSVGKAPWKKAIGAYEVPGAILWWPSHSNSNTKFVCWFGFSPSQILASYVPSSFG